MIRLTRICLGTALIALGSTWVVAQPPAAAPAAAPAPAAAAPTSDLFPTKVGTKWVYKIADAQNIEVKVESLKDGEATLVTTVNNKPVAKESVKVQADGVYRTKVNDVAITPPVKILALPATKDANWLVDSKVQDQVIKGKFVIKDEKEKVKLKDNKEYDAVVVEGAEFDVAGTKTLVKTWYAPGKGMIKLSYAINNIDATLELVEFVEAK